MPTLPNRIWKIPVWLLRRLDKWIGAISIGGNTVGGLLGELTIDIKEVQIPMIGISILAIVLWVLRPFRRLENKYARWFTRAVRLEPEGVALEASLSARFSCEADGCTFETPCKKCAVKSGSYSKPLPRCGRERMALRQQLQKVWKQLKHWLYT